ncbi:MAG: molybdopterin-dependent oxidoreductase [Acidobacteria bacterium]|nr:molybdopterin-dependent oxidoreductase [Acidobacteriota bacterium]
MSFEINRRDYLRFAAGGALGAATSGVSLRGLSRLNAALASEEVIVPGGPENWVPSLCSLCPAACGLRVRTIGPRAVRIQGSSFHPVSHGGLCPKGLAGLQVVYHPDRLRAPLRNVGSRKSPRWREISWEEAISTVAARLRRLRGAGQAHQVVWIDRPERNLWSRLVRRFLAAYGSPNYLTMPSGLDAIQTAVYLQQGVTQPVAYDLEGTRYLLSFGVNLLEGWGSPTAVMRAFGRWRDAAAGRRTKFVQIEPRFSMTAARADEWVALRPGTDAAMALGIAYVLITEGLYDAAFVRDHTFGFEDWRDAAGRTHMGFRSLVLSEYRLNDVAVMTGVPAETILRLAREFGQNRPAVAVGDHQTSTLPGHPYAAMAVHSLNALSGSLDTPGGVVLQAELPLKEEEIPPAGKNSWPRLDETPEHHFPGHHLARLPRAILSRKPYPVEAVLLHDVNPVFSLPNGEVFRQSFQEVPFIASFTSFMDETSSLADLVLPAPTGLERWQEAASPPAFPYAVESISPPVIAARHRTRHPGDILLEIAKFLGGQVGAALPFENVEAYLRHRVGDLFAAQTCSVYSTRLDEAWNRLVERSGWWAPTYSTADELWEQMKERGGWWEPTYYYGEWERTARTPSRRFEFYSQTLARWASSRPDFARAVGLEPGDDRLFLPHQPPTVEAPPGYPLLLMPIEVLPLAGGEGGHLPYLQQIAGQHLFATWESWLEIHPETARKLGIRDGDRVSVESPRGRAQVRARLYAGARPEVVHLPLGYGHTEGSRWGRRGVNPMALLDERYDPVAGLAQTSGTHVKVYRS